MKAPRRLVEENELFAKLVSEYQRTAPPPEAMHAMVDAVESAKEPLTPTSTRSIGLFAKLHPWALLAVVSAVGLVSTTFVTLGRPSHSAPSTAARTLTPTDPDMAITAVPSPEPMPSLVPSVAIGDLPNSPEPRANITTPAPVAKPSLRREIELIAKAREALTKGDSAACLETLATHDREFPRGKFMPEARVMRIDATMASGNRRAARDLARAFLADTPDSPYATRLRSLLASTESE